jgi:ferredoxin
MAKVVFLIPGQPAKEVETEENSKILAVARRAAVPIRYGCASCRCGTCGVAVNVEGELLPMENDERTLLTKIKLPTDGSVRLSCRARIKSGKVTVDLAFQDTYSPEDYVAADYEDA